MSTPPGRAQVTLTAQLSTSAVDARRGVVRLHGEVFAALGLAEWDAVRLVGTRATVALAAGFGVAPGTVVEWQGGNRTGAARETPAPSFAPSGFFASAPRATGPAAPGPGLAAASAGTPAPAAPVVVAEPVPEIAVSDLV